jgi:endonuclease YncB( thermonuclease family)
MPLAIFILATLLAAVTSAAAEPSFPIPEGDTITARCVGVYDGDTLTVLDAASVQHKVRLQGIDAPERGQPFGNVARDRLAALTMGQTVTVETFGRDRYSRTRGRIVIEGQDVNRQLVLDGLAWHYVRYSKAEALTAAEREA